MSNILEGLNPSQKEAVLTTEGPVLVLAGAGTGKTKVLTSRIAYIIEQGLSQPYEILALTFTNKAANEIKERVVGLTEQHGSLFWIGTFHSIAVRILRQEAETIGIDKNFNILDDIDTKRVMEEILEDMNIDKKQYPAYSFLSAISSLKDQGFLPEDITTNTEVKIDDFSVSVIYKKYQERLKSLSSLDFDDLLLFCYKLFKNNPEALIKWQNRFKYVLIDEYQDTNRLQYLLIKILVANHNNIFCVGDDDQSIYSWRGAVVENILDFYKHFQNAKVFKLVQNYRSTMPILEASHTVISKNENRWDKKLFSESQGENPKVYKAYSSKDEAAFVASEIMKLNKAGEKFKEIAILVRSNFLTRLIEMSLSDNRIPYRVFGSTAFYSRKEIKDAIAYLKLYYQRNDDLSFLRIINTPKRGLGEGAIVKIRNYAASQEISLYEASCQIIDHQILSSKQAKELSSFVSIFNTANFEEYDRNSDILSTMLESSGYIAHLKSEQDYESRIKNIEELYVDLDGQEDLDSFFESIALANDKEAGNAEDDNAVNIMSLHRSKGLEFNTAFLIAWEEGIIPSFQSMEDARRLDEERRLAYVGITRAKTNLYITHSSSREQYGSISNAFPSRFLQDILKTKKYKEVFNQGSSFSNSFSNNYTNKAPKSSFNSSNFKSVDSFSKSIIVGSKVTHASMGEGVVKSINGPVASVDFGEKGLKKLMLSFLTKV